jgi:ATP dependent DNA ligase-like protein
LLAIIANPIPKPELVGQIEFTEWTPDGHLRHSKFVGLREDKEARDGTGGLKKLEQKIVYNLLPPAKNACGIVSKSC